MQLSGISVAVERNSDMTTILPCLLTHAHMTALLHSLNLNEAIVPYCAQFFTHNIRHQEILSHLPWVDELLDIFFRFTGTLIFLKWFLVLVVTRFFVVWVFDLTLPWHVREESCALIFGGESHEFGPVSDALPVYLILTSLALSLLAGVSLRPQIFKLGPGYCEYLPPIDCFHLGLLIVLHLIWILRFSCIAFLSIHIFDWRFDIYRLAARLCLSLLILLSTVQRRLHFFFLSNT